MDTETPKTKKIECPECGGSGYSDCPYCHAPEAETCDECNGTGEIDEEAESA